MLLRDLFENNIIDFVSRHKAKKNKDFTDKLLTSISTGFSDQEQAERETRQKIATMEELFKDKCSFLATPTTLSDFEKGTNPLYALLLTVSFDPRYSGQINIHGDSPEKIKFANNIFLNNYDKIKELVEWYDESIREIHKEIIKKYNPPVPQHVRYINGEYFFYNNSLQTIDRYLKTRHI